MGRSKRGILVAISAVLLALLVGCSRAEGELLDVLDTELKLVVLMQKLDGSLLVSEDLFDPKPEMNYIIEKIQGFVYPGYPAYVLVKKLKNQRTNEILYVFVRDLKPWEIGNGV